MQRSDLIPVRGHRGHQSGNRSHLACLGDEKQADPAGGSPMEEFKLQRSLDGDGAEPGIPTSQGLPESAASPPARCQLYLFPRPRCEGKITRARHCPSAGSMMPRPKLGVRAGLVALETGGRL